MQFLIALLVLIMLINSISSETTKEPTSILNDGQPLAGPAKDISKINLARSNPLLNSLWVYRPETHQPPKSSDVASRRTIVKPAQSLTRLAKTLTLGFDPYFSKGYFEPFERRPRPVTLVAFRKNGLLPRAKANAADSKSAEVAELQSPFNDISNFWVDD